MSRFLVALCALCLGASVSGAEEVLRIRVWEALESLPTAHLEDTAASNRDAAERNALEESALVFGGIIYGWDFEYEIGERARDIAERFALADRGKIEFGDPRLTVTDASIENSKLVVWMEYRPDPAQSRRLAAWRTTAFKPVQGTGVGPLSYDTAAKREALEDAARSSVRAFLRGTERNRPKEAKGTVALVAAPRFWIDAGRLTVSARFRLAVDELVPFSAY